jgi:hypothetical protein
VAKSKHHLNLSCEQIKPEQNDYGPGLGLDYGDLSGSIVQFSCLIEADTT